MMCTKTTVGAVVERSTAALRIAGSKSAGSTKSKLIVIKRAQITTGH